jgi:hypothetical protein
VIHVAFGSNDTFGRTVQASVHLDAVVFESDFTSAIGSSPVGGKYIRGFCVSIMPKGKPYAR